MAIELLIRVYEWSGNQGSIIDGAKTIVTLPPEGKWWEHSIVVALNAVKAHLIQAGVLPLYTSFTQPAEFRRYMTSANIQIATLLAVQELILPYSSLVTVTPIISTDDWTIG